jgi:beta-glucuronidase
MISIGILILAALAFTVWHLFYRDTFIPPSDPAGPEIRAQAGIPFLCENGLPFPAGIQSTDRLSVSLSGECFFRPENASEIAVVTVPHCFNTADSALRDFAGIVVYERNFTLPTWEAGALIRLGFLGSFYRSEVWLDDTFLGSHEGGYLPFYFDLTKLVLPGKTHRLKVRVDNRIDATSLPPRLFAGHNLGWQPYGGLHREVLIEICPPQYCFKLKVETEGEQVHASALFHRPNATATPLLEKSILRLRSGKGEILAEAAPALRWDASGQFGAIAHTFTVPSPHFWEPGAPHLYHLEIVTAAETCATAFGFRRIQACEGKLLLNGKPLTLRGVCRHQEDREFGLAQNLASVQRDLEAIRALNGNFARLAHYPHATETLDLCDQLGLCAWVEIPLYQAGLGIIRFLFDKTKRKTGKSLRALPGLLWGTHALENPVLLNKARGELLKMIERDCNHPAVLFWGLGNECWTLHPSGARALKWLRTQAERFDTSRLFGYAAFAMPGLSPLFERAFEATDVLAINEYFGWYYDKVDRAGAFLSALARKHPAKPLLVTETGADAVPGQHTRQKPPPRGYSEEYQAWLLEEQWRQMRSVATFAGLSIWVLKDFLCPEYREDNPIPFYNLKGLLDRDSQPKLAYQQVQKLFGETLNQSGDPP